MNQISFDTIKKLNKKLPQDIKDVYSSELTTEKIENIARKNGLHIDQIGEVVSEVGYVMLGLTHPNQFVSNIKRRTGLPDEKVNTIAKDINEQIFQPIRHSLMKLHMEQKTEIQKQSERQVEQKVGAQKQIERPVEQKPVEQKNAEEQKEEPQKTIFVPQQKLEEKKIPEQKKEINEQKWREKASLVANNLTNKTESETVDLSKKFIQTDPYREQTI